MTDRVDINHLLHEMRALKSQTQVFGAPGAVGREADVKNPVEQVKGPGFSNLFSQALEKVNEVQQSSSAMSQAYIRGDRSIDVADVMIASQKSSIAIQATTQVRNRVIEAYKDIMNMPI